MTLTDPRVDAFARQFLSAAQLSVQCDSVESDVVQLGSRAVRVTIPQANYPHGLNPLTGLRKASPNSAGQHAPDFEIIFFQNIEGARLPTALWPSNWHFPLGQIAQSKTGRYRVSLDRHTGTVSVMDLVSRQCGIWAYEAQKMPYWWCATPFRLQFSWIADTFDAELVHGAAVNLLKRTSLISGLSGAGKSTLTHFLHLEGAEIISDDFVLVEGDFVSSPYTRTKLHRKSFELIPEFKEKAANWKFPQEKMILNDVSPARHGVLVLDEIVDVQKGDTARFAVASQSEVFKDLAIGTLSGVLGGNRRTLTRISRLIRNHSCTSFTSPPSRLNATKAWASRG